MVFGIQVPRFANEEICFTDLSTAPKPETQNHIPETSSRIPVHENQVSGFANVEGLEGRAEVADEYLKFYTELLY